MKLIIYLFLLPGLLFAQGKKNITLDEIFTKGAFRLETVSGFRSMKDGRYYSEINKQGILQKVQFNDGMVAEDIVNFKELRYDKDSIKVDDYVFNTDETKLLLLTESTNIYRRSILHKVYIYDLATKEVRPLHSSKVLHASFSPNSDKVAYVFENNLYYFDLISNETVAVTNNGDYNHINGNCDWVYEEEFQFTKAYEWSAKGDYIAYYHFDQTQVPEYNFFSYEALYPTDNKFKYPKAGEKNSIVDINIYHLETEKTVHCKLGDEEDIYIPRIVINPFNNSLVVYKLNRLQNELEFLEINSKTGNSVTIYAEKNEYYVEINDNIYFLSDRNAFVYSSEKDGHNHLYLHDIEMNRSSQITRGDWDAASILGVDETTQTIFYLSAELSPLERNVFSIGLNGEQKVNLTPDKGWHDVSFSNGFDYFLDKYSSINIPTRFSIHDKKGSLVRVLKDNAALKSKMLDYDIAPLTLLTVPNEDGILLNAWMIKPSNFSQDKKYPLLMFQYSGPGSQQVSNQYGLRDYWWHQMLAQKGYIIVCVDGTGTGFRGEAFKKKTYLQLGKFESDDQIAAAKYFAKQPYIDASRIGIWGWSYGGYMSSICLLKGADVFKAAIAVAPVTNWRYYDNIYTERYMRTPAENASGYDDNSPINMVNELKGSYLLIHGTADDNVHLQNSIMMTDRLIKANKDFDSEFYPNKNHGIGGASTRYHLYNRMTNFILEKL